MKKSSVLLRFSRDERAAILVWFALTIPVVLGVFALSLDLGRFTDMHTEMKDMADAAALAAANALDGTETAFTKAETAVAALNNDARFADSGVQIADLVYAASYSDLAAGNYLDETSVDDAKKAQWVQAITTTGTMNTLFIKVVGGNSTVGASVRSTAGTQTVACAVQPLFMCLPSAGKTLSKGQMVQVKRDPGGAWGNGNFGLLDPPNAAPNQVQDLLNEGMASSVPPMCYVNKLFPHQGTVASLQDAFNTRFDLWPNGNIKNSIAFKPGPNVLKGMDLSGQCAKNNPVVPDRPADVMPRDACFTTDTCGGPYGNKGYDAALKTYWENHHGAGTYPATGFTSRFAAYMAEAGYDEDGNQIGSPVPLIPGSKEQMAPTCAATKPSVTRGNGGWDRRVMYAAMVDCTDPTVADWLANGNSTKSPLSSADIGMFFVTEPTDGQAIYLEFIKRITKGDDEGKLHDIVQLYPNPQDGN